MNATHISGSSAGAIVGGFLAAGMQPAEMVQLILSIKREDIWDVGIFQLGLLKGELLQAILEKNLPSNSFDLCKPLGVAAFELFGMKTKIISSGNLATAIRASCCFPGLFCPVEVDGSRCIDGGVFDRAGLMALQGVPSSSNLIVNIVCDAALAADSRIPEKFSNASLLTIVMNNIPDVSPSSMDETGPLAYESARSAMKRALASGNLQQVAYNNWILHIDGIDACETTSRCSKSSSINKNDDLNDSNNKDSIRSSSNDNNDSSSSNTKNKIYNCGSNSDRNNDGVGKKRDGSGLVNETNIGNKIISKKTKSL